jgi:hypothetical protein
MMIDGGITLPWLVVVKLSSAIELLVLSSPPSVPSTNLTVWSCVDSDASVVLEEFVEAVDSIVGSSMIYKKIIRTIFFKNIRDIDL